MMKTFFTNRLSIALLFFFFGLATATVLWGKFPSWNPLYKEPKELDPFQMLLHGNMDPFEEMEKIQKQMLETDDVFGQFMGGKAKKGNAIAWNQSEDANTFTIEVTGKAISPEKLKVNIQNQQISIAGSSEERREDGSVSIAEFQRSFPAPADVDVTNFSMERKGDKILIHFPKKHGT